MYICTAPQSLKSVSHKHFNEKLNTKLTLFMNINAIYAHFNMPVTREK